MAYAHIQMVLYRPFLHYVSQSYRAKNIDRRSYACAAACVSVSRNIVHLTGQMKRRGLLVGSYWFYMYTTFFAIISLVFYILENPQSPEVEEILKDAYEGRDTLAALAAKSLAADRCSRTLTVSTVSGSATWLHSSVADGLKRSFSSNFLASYKSYEMLPRKRHSQLHLRTPLHNSKTCTALNLIPQEPWLVANQTTLPVKTACHLLIIAPGSVLRSHMIPHRPDTISLLVLI